MHKRINYLIEVDDQPFVKLGVSSDLEKRMIDLQVGNPYMLRLKAFWLGGELVEKYLHDELRFAWVRGEWYKNTSGFSQTLFRLLAYKGLKYHKAKDWPGDLGKVGYF